MIQLNSKKQGNVADIQ